MERKEQEDKISENRALQIGTGNRSEKIRTYNYKDNRVSEHRLNENFSLESILNNGNLEELIQSLIAYNQKLQLESSLNI
jgi:peptide chain release factor 1